MLPKYFRWGFGLGLLGGAINLVTAALHIYQGQAPSTDLVRPIIMTLGFAWAMTLATQP